MNLDGKLKGKIEIDFEMEYMFEDPIIEKDGHISSNIRTESIKFGKPKFILDKGGE